MSVDPLRENTAHIVVERMYFIFFYKQRWSLAVMTAETRPTREAIRQYYWHTLVGFDDRLNRSLGLPVSLIEWGVEEPNWEEVYHQRLPGRHSLPPGVLSRRTTRW